MMRLSKFMLYLSIGVMFMAFWGCTRKSLSPETYVQWCNDPDNALTQSKTIGDFEYTVEYRPAELLALQEMRSEQVDAAAVKEKAKNYEGVYYFIFKIASSDKSQDILKVNTTSHTDYYQRLQYFVSEINNDFSLAVNGDTLPCSFHSYERTYNLEPYTTFIVAFDKPQSIPEKAQDMTFIYRDQVLGTGPVQIKIAKTAQEDIPQIKTTL